jgi:alkylation response protein AidB-like acyl-CoA dehydrogenase
MTLARSAEQAQFAASLHDMLDNADGPGAARAWAGGDRVPGLAAWRALAALGVTALAVPERAGGLGASFTDVVVACEEIGHHALPGPVAESVAAVPVLLAALSASPPSDIDLSASPLPENELSASPLPENDLSASPLPENELSEIVVWLPGLADGELLATLAAPPWLPFAADADAAGLVLLADGGVVRLATPGARHRSVDRARSLFETAGGQVLAGGPAAAEAVARALDAGALASAAQLLGAGRALLEASVRHAGQRAQFGRPIGSFQAVKHHLADVAIGLEFAGPLLSEAAVTLDGGGRHAARDVSAAKVACTDAARRAARVALQVHGAIGYTEEHDLHLWLAKVRALAGAWGSQAEHRARVMAAISAPERGPDGARPGTAGEPAWS